MTSEELQTDEIDLNNKIDIKKNSNSQFNIEEFINRNKIPLGLGFLGLILFGLGMFLYKDGYLTGSDKIEVIKEATEGQNGSNELVVEIAGSIQKPGVYKMSNDARVEDLLIAAGGVSADADRVWMEKMLNRAAKLSDGQKIFIPEINEQSIVLSDKTLSEGGSSYSEANMVGQGLININTASASELESLNGIGPVYGKSIIEHRPYSSVEELVTKNALKKNVYEKIKDKVTVY